MPKDYDMAIVDAVWTPQVNFLIIRCSCGIYLRHPADRWTVRCSGCGSTMHLGVLRDAYAGIRR